jgi:hypothetical protein
VADKAFDPYLFDDSFLLSIDFSEWTEQISISLYCPNAKRLRKNNRYLKVIFKRILFFGFEAAALGEFGTKPFFLNGIYKLAKSDELKKWKKRIDDLAKPDASYPKGMRSRKYKGLHHFVIDAMDFQPLAVLNGSRGFQILCRDFAIERIPNPNPSSSSNMDPVRIPAG